MSLVAVVVGVDVAVVVVVVVVVVEILLPLSSIFGAISLLFRLMDKVASFNST